MGLNPTYPPANQESLSASVRVSLRRNYQFPHKVDKGAAHKPSPSGKVSMP